MPRKPIDAVVMERFWRLRGAGLSYPVAARRVGIAEKTAHRALVIAGGVRPRPRPSPAGRFLSFAEREEIAVGLAGGLTPAAIARQLGRHRSTISREIARHRHAHDAKLHYRASGAQWRAEQNARRPKPAKLATNAKLRERVAAMLGEKWSPEQIAATLRSQFVDPTGDVGVARDDLPVAVCPVSRGAAPRTEHVSAHRAGAAPPEAANR